ncbi:Capn13 [Symbiodinium sp. KB8]|nr:Capn13 [Symbiodinium sp. KB8]
MTLSNYLFWNRVMVLPLQCFDRHEHPLDCYFRFGQDGLEGESNSKQFFLYSAMFYDGCDGKELTKARAEPWALEFLNHTFEDVELHLSPGAIVSFLGAVLKSPAFGRPGPPSLLVLPGLPGSLQIVLTLLAVGLLNHSAAVEAMAEDAHDGEHHIPLPGVELKDLAAPNIVDLARTRLPKGADLKMLPQHILEENLLWQAADELRFYADTEACDAVDLVSLHGALINVLHGYAFNYYHFLTEQVPALIALRHELDWLPEDRIHILYAGMSWQAELIEAVGFRDSQLLRAAPCRAFRGDLVYTAAVPDSKAAEPLLQTQALFPPLVQSLGLPLKVLLVERRCEGSPGLCTGTARRGRSVTNFQEVFDAAAQELSPAEVIKFRPEEHPVAAQAASFAAAAVVIAAVGAALANVVWMSEGSMVVALHPAHPDTSFSVYSSRCGQSYFWHMAEQLGLEYRGFLCADMTVSEGGTVDVEDFASFLRAEVATYMLSRKSRHVGLDPQEEAKAKEEEAAAAEEWTYVYPKEEVLPEDSGNEEAESKAGGGDVTDAEEQWDEGLVEARQLLGELELIPKEARTKELDDTVWGVTMPYCAWVMGKWGVTVHTPKEVLWDIARADPLFAKLAKIDPFQFMDERKTEDEAIAEECQEVLELGDKVDSSKKIFGRGYHGQKVDTYLNGPELVDNINAQLAGRLFVDPQFPANSSTIGTRAVREITGWGRPPAGHSLVKDGFEMDDIKQGGLGDCWFISICAVVAEWPEILRKMFYPVESPSPSGVYAVRVYDGSQWVWVLVDTLLPGFTFAIFSCLFPAC